MGIVSEGVQRFRDLDRRAVRLSVDVVDRVEAGDLGRPTPCSEWDLAALLAHMTVQHQGFALAAQGRRSQRADWAPVPLGDDPAGRYAAAADLVVTAFAAMPDDAQLHLPELSVERAFPAEPALSFHFVDYVVHSWDVARSLGVPLAVDSDVARAALEVALRVPNTPERRGPGFAFGPGIERADGGPDTGESPDSDADAVMDRVLALLGRSPRWPNL